jgi:hypothetical protein
MISVALWLLAGAYMARVELETFPYPGPKWSDVVGITVLALLFWPIAAVLTLCAPTSRNQSSRR